MSNTTDREKEIFNQAIELASPESRAAYLKGACGHDQELRHRIEALLTAYDSASGFIPTKEGSVLPDTPLSEGLGTKVGRYKLLQRIGEGGMGVIYMAEQTEPVTRKVALKIIKLGMDTKSVIARFEAERQALAMMDHPNIAKVLDAGSTETGRPYFVMELVKGVPINQYCDKNHLPTKERLQLFMAVCQAIHHAHQKGVIHRDIKPSNILVTLHDGRPVPKVIDFGIAKATNQKLTEKTLFTHFAQIIGTPAYMSPEQAEMSGLDVDTRTDVYSLGVLLYELLTGTTPFPEKELLSKGYGEMQRIIAEQEPERPSLRVSTLLGEQQTIISMNRSTERLTLQRQIKGDLDWIVMKALEKDRTHRYDSPNNLAADIERHLTDEPVLAAQPTALYQLGKLYRRHKVALAAAACFVLLLTVSACVSAAQAIKNKSLFTAAEEARLNEMSARERETELRRIAENERERGQKLLYTAHMNLAKQAWDVANVNRVIELLDLHRPQPDRPDLRNFEWFYLDRLCHGHVLTLKGHGGEVIGVAFSPEGKRLASASQDRTVKVWDVMSGQQTLLLEGHSNFVYSVAFSPDGKWLASASRDKTIKLWNATNGQEMLTLRGHTDGFPTRARSGVLSLAFSPDGKRLASASQDRTVKVWDIMNGKEMLTLSGHSNSVNSVAFSPDGKLLASGSHDRTVKVWDMTTGREILTLRGHDGVVGCVTFSPDGKRLVSGSSDQTIKAWDTTSGQEMFTLRGHNNGVWSLAFSPDGKLLASGSEDRTVKVWDTNNGQEAFGLKGHNDGVWNLAFSPDGKHLASASGDQTVKLWDVTSAQETMVLKGHTRHVIGVAFSPDGKRLASASSDRTVKVWDATSGHETLTLKGHTNGVWRVAFSPDGNRLVSASGEIGNSSNPGELKVWDANSGQEIFTLIGHTRAVRDAAFSPDGKRLASASSDHTVRLWDATSGQETHTLKGHTDRVNSVAFSPDGKRLASADQEGTVKLWDAASGQETLTLKGHTNGVISVAFSPDGKRLASASDDRTVKVWNATNGLEMHTLRGHNGDVNGVAFSPDGKRLASASADETVKLWDATSGQEILTLKGHGGDFNDVAFNPDGKRLVSANNDGTVQIWDATPRSPASPPDAKMR